jgi:tryptophanyl-tRNA synthetase
MKTVFSGIQPSGELHLGNYLGAIRNWVTLQNQDPPLANIFFIADYHAITQTYDVKAMAARVEEMVLDLLALGIDPNRSLLFLQSSVPEHTELCWVFNSVTGHGDLERMTQFKDKSEHDPHNINAGIFDYPVLQAADILLYKAEIVPVGADQLQHIELTRRIARSFNHRWGQTFPECEAAMTNLPKLLGDDGKAKMSKSLGNHISLSLFAEPKKMRKRLAKFATDPHREKREDPGNPDVCNVFTMHKAISSDADLVWVREGCTTAGIGCADCKAKLADNLDAHFAGFVTKRAELVATPGVVAEALDAGAVKARKIAGETMREVRDKLGLWRSR